MKHPVTKLLELAAAIAGRLSLRATHELAAAAGWIWWTVLRYRRKIILANLAQAFPEKSAAELRGLGRRATTHLVLTLLEFLRIPHYLKAGFGGDVRSEGMEHLWAAKAEGRGLLVLAGHLGSFELAVASVAHATKPVSLVVKPFPKAVDAFITRVRTSSGLSVIPAKGAVKPILTALKNNEIVVFAIDQNATRSIGVFVDFFGKRASTMSALATLAARTKAPVIAATPYRAADGTNVLKVLPAIPFEEKATREETIVHMTQVYTRVIEDAIRAHPEQWFWTHKRWRTQ